MNRDDYINSIAKYFGRLSHEIRALNAVNRFDINSVTEDFLVPVLKLAFDCPDLRNQNEIQMNFPAVDLGCRTSRVSIQVSTDGSSAKVTKTLDTFRKHNLEKLFDSVFVLALVEKQSSYTAKALREAITALPIAFDPTMHIIDIGDLLTLIAKLDTDKLGYIADYLASEWTKRDQKSQFREHLDKFLEFSTNKVDVEKNSKKYIPSIFVETQSTKEEMRLFVNPLFFYRKIQDVLKLFDYDRLNSLLRIANEREFAPDLDPELLTSTPATFSELTAWLERTEAGIEVELAKVRPLAWGRGDGIPAFAPKDPNSAGWIVARYQAESGATGLVSRLQDAQSLIGLIRKKVFLITSMAGQGKTNFVCDLVENQFRSFEIPCLYVPARELNMYPSGSKIISYISNNRYSPNFANIHDYISLFNKIALERSKPFLIVIDGINEVTDLNSFNDELKTFCGSVAQYDMVKVVLTCRAEFFDEKYASMLDEPFSDTIHRVTDLRSKMSEATKSRLLRGYLKHFQIKGSVAGTAAKFLKNDLLLLRIFCERYEGCDVGYTADIYKGDLFEAFLRKKIESFPQQVQGRALPTLFKIVSAMLKANDYSKLSVRDFSADEQEIVRRFVADDVILRQEVDSDGLAAIGDLMISFTYDELRDFIISYALVKGGGDEVPDLEETLARLPGLPIVEGVHRYVYLLARKAKDAAAIQACESPENFVEHFSLNIHLLPPELQSDDDVARAKAILADPTAAERLRRIAIFLVHRGDENEPLNIMLLLQHLNGLETDDHKSFIRCLFSHPHDYREYAWLERLSSLIEDVSGDEAGKDLGERPAHWLAFFLHVASHSGWLERERVSNQFREAKDMQNCQQALELVRAAPAERISSLVSDIEDAGAI